MFGGLGAAAKNAAMEEAKGQAAGALQDATGEALGDNELV